MDVVWLGCLGRAVALVRESVYTCLMVVSESHAVRRLVGRTGRGDDLPSVFCGLCEERGIRTAWVRATGALEWVELIEFDQIKQSYREPRRLHRPVELLNLEGNISRKGVGVYAQLHATVSYETGGGIVVVGGRLQRARAFSCEFVLEAFEDLSLERVPNKATGLYLWPEDEERLSAEDSAPAVLPAETRAGDTGFSWAAVAAVSERAEERNPGRKATRTFAGPARPDPKMALPSRKPVDAPEYLEEPTPEAGDFVDHKQFGRCRVQGEDEAGGLMLRAENGVHRTIKLDTLRVLPFYEENGKRVYPLESRKK